MAAWQMAAAAALASFFPQALSAQTCLARVEAMVNEVRAAAFPEISRAELRVRAFASNSDYFRAIFAWRRFVFGLPMRYAILANPRQCTLQAPEEGVRGIVAHELAHVLYYKRGSRLHLTGLVRMTSPRWRSRFERAADATAISRGFGPGLKAYRQWLYPNVPPDKLREKLRDYLSPDEIDAAARARPSP